MADNNGSKTAAKEFQMASETWHPQIVDTLQQWATQRLQSEIENRCQHALRLTGFQSRLSILAFLDLLPDEQRRLVGILPTGARFSGEPFEAIRRALPASDQQLVNRINENITRRMDWGAPGEAREYALMALQAEKQREARLIGKALIKELKRHARGRGFNVSVWEPLMIEASASRQGKNVSLMFDALNPFIVNYGLRVKRSQDSEEQCLGYLERLGLGQSGWLCPAIESIPQVAETAFEFCEWHIEEMVRLD